MPYVLLIFQPCVWYNICKNDVSLFYIFLIAKYYVKNVFFNNKK